MMPLVFGQVVIGRTMSERAIIDPGWVKCSELVDEVWVPTEWHRRVFTDAGVPLAKAHLAPYFAIELFCNTNVYRGSAGTTCMINCRLGAML